MNFFVIDHIEPKRPADGVEIRIIPGEKMTMVFFRVEPGVNVPEHAHPHEQMGTVLSGTLELVIGGEKQVVRKGGAYHVPSGVAHSGQCLESTVELIEVFTPPRDDLIGS